MRDPIGVKVNGEPFEVPAGTTASSAFLLAQAPCRTSISGEPRSALCGMGICFECRAVVDGIPHVRTCQLLCYPGMILQTQR
jgi:sarcosine oxidase subunit alpha